MPKDHPTFSVKNWSEFQHYSDRTPPWIKLYNSLLDDHDFGVLPDASKAHLLAIWLLASRSKNQVPCDADWISRRINATEPVDLKIFLDAGFLILNQDDTETASGMLAKCYTRERGETETETETEKPKSVSTRGRATLCPEGWFPDHDTMSALIAEGFSQEQINRAWREMVDWSHGNGKKRVKWSAVLRNWVRRNAKTNGHSKRSLEDTMRGMQDKGYFDDRTSNEGAGGSGGGENTLQLSAPKRD